MTETVQSIFDPEGKKKKRPITREETPCFDLLRIKYPKKNPKLVLKCIEI